MFNITFSVLSVTTFLVVLLSFLLGFFLIFTSTNKPERRVFGIFAIAVSLWIFTTFLVDHSKSQKLAFLLSKLVFVGPITIPSLLVHFSYLFPKRQKISLRYIFFFYLSSALLLLMVPSTLLVSSIKQQAELTTFSYGLAYPIFVIHFIGLMLFFFFRVIRSYKKATGISRLQIRYLLLGILIAAILSATTNIFFPIIGIQNLSIIGADSVIILLALTGYSIVKHRLLDIRLIVTRSLIYGLLVSIVALSFIFVLFLSAQFFDNSPTSRNVIAFIVAFIIVFGLDPLKKLLSRATDRVFFKAKIDYQSLLREISEILAFEINRDELIRKIRATLREGLKVKSAVTLLRKTGSQVTEKFEALSDLLQTNPNLSIRNDSVLIAFLREHKHPSLLESLERKVEDTSEDKRDLLVASKEEFERMGIALAAPIFAQGHLIAVLALGPKLSGDSFGNDDLQLIEVLAPQIGSAIQKASLFEEVRQFGEGLKIKVEEATKELSDRNVSLQTLQNITKDVTRTLDFNKAVQNIADSVANELGYIGSILVFFDEDGYTIRARAITQTPITKRAIDILPIKFTDYSTDIRDPKSTSLGHEVLRTGEMRMTEDFSDVVCPPLPKLLAKTIQKVVGIKSMILIPIVSEGKTIGVIEIGTKKKSAEISKQEIATMQSLADELGIVSRNLKLFDQLRKTNDQLEVANAHLKELDRAKSEFVSIASHQLRTPMTGIMGYLSMMTQGDFGKIKPEHQKILTDLLSESQRMIRLINQFLNVSKIEAGKFTYTWKPTQLEELVEQVMKEVNKPAADKSLKLIYKKLKTKLPLIQADADKIEDVVLNLIDNAIKYTAKGTIDVSLALEGDVAHFRVKDSGIGIKPQDANELFNKFVRGSGIAQIHPDGSGLGLFIAKSIIDAHGGKIWVESTGEGKGSTFQFTLPLTPPPGLLSPSTAAAHIVKPKDRVTSLKNE